MNARPKPSERGRRDWIIILIILLFGFLCVILAGGWAIRFSPNWKLNTDMGSNLDPNSNFLTNVPLNFIEPLDPAILTQPVWVNVFLTPGALFDTRTPAPTTVTGITPIPVTTAAPTQTSASPTITRTAPPPTNTAVYIPPTRTFTPGPSAINVDLQITKTDGVTTYTGGSPVTYTIVVSNNSSNGVTGAIVSDPKPSQVTTWSWACTSQTNGANGCTPMLTNTNFTDTVNLPGNSSITYTVTANIAVSATGNLVNTASVTVPASGYNDTNNANNSATDTDTQYIPSADLQIAKTDGVTTYIAGGSVTYTITVSNPSGPDNVINATVADNTLTPATNSNIASATWTCVPSGVGASCAANGSGNINDNTVDLPVGTSVTYTVNVITSASATGNLVNMASVAVPLGYTDPNTGNNSATDTDSQASADLSITKTDGLTAVNPGATVIYTIRVTNGGPDNLTGAILSDPAAAGLTKTAVACSAPPGQCVTPPTIGQLESGTFALPLLNNGQFYEITVSATVDATSGSVTNTADVAAPVGTIDPSTGNNFDLDTNTVNLVADLSITVDDGLMVYEANDTLVYTVIVANNGPSDVTGATVNSTLPFLQIATWSWDCTNEFNASNCNSLSPASASDFSDLVDIQSGGYIEYTVTANISVGPTGNLTVTTIIANPVTETVPGNNSDADINELAINLPNGDIDIGNPPNGDDDELIDGNPMVISLPTALQVGNDVGVYDLVYYEEQIDIGGGIQGVALDWVTIEISDGSTWYTVFNWGGGGADGNTNVAVDLVGNGNGDGPCTGEPDNCRIDGALLLSQTGITIDVDSLSLGIPAGSYPYLRITSYTAGGGGDGNLSFDGIYIVNP